MTDESRTTHEPESVQQAELHSRRVAKRTLGLTAIGVTIGYLCSAMLLMAHITAQQLANAATDHFRVWTLISDKIPYVAQTSGNEGTLKFLSIYRQEFDELLEIEVQKRREVDRLLGRLRSPVMSLFSFMEEDDIIYFERTDIPDETKSFVRGLSGAGKLPTTHGSFRPTTRP